MKQDKGSSGDAKYLLITRIKKSLSEEDVLKIAASREEHFQTVPGLIRKFWARDEETGIFHGIFEFGSKDALEEYLKTDFAQSVSDAYQTVEPITLQVLRVQKERSFS